MPDTVTLGYIHPADVAHSWHSSVLNLIAHDMGAHQRVVRGGWIAVRSGTGGIIEARNKVVERFLDSDPDWLFWVDTDMGFTPDTVDRLVASADVDERPIMGALCFAQRETELDGLGGFRTTPIPTVYQYVELEDGRHGFTPWLDYPRDQVVPVAATGSACLVIHRRVLEAVHAEHGPRWYDRMTNPSTGQKISEDLSFCAKAAALGFPTHVDTSVKTSHLKPIWLAEEDFDRHRATAEVAS